MSIIFRDTFTDANGTLIENHTPDMPVGSNKWQEYGGNTYKINNNSLQYSSGSNWDTEFAGYDIGVSDFNLSFTLNAYSSAGGTPYPVFRASSSTSFVAYRINSGGRNQLVYYSGNSFVTIGDGGLVYTFNVGDTFNIVVSGSSIKTYVNGALDISVTSTFNQTSTIIGFDSQHGTSQWDNVTAMDLNTIAYDGFDRANNASSLGVADTGQTWSTHSGNAGISSSMAYSPDSLVDSRSLLNIGVSDNFKVLGTIVWNYYMGIIFRAIDSNNFYMVRLFGTAVGLYKYISNSSTLIASYSYTPVKGQSYQLQARVQGNQIICSLNGTDVITYTDSDTTLISGTNVGMRFYNNNGTDYLDNFEADKTTSSTPTNPPNVTIVSVDHYKISNQSSMNQSDIVFKFDTDITQWTVNVMGTSPSGGTLVSSGGAVTAGNTISTTIPYNDMYEQGYNKVNIYGLNSIGWTPYQTDPNGPNVYYLSMNGTSDYIQIPAFNMTHVLLDVYIDSNQPSGTMNDGYLRTGQTSEHVLIDDQNRNTSNGYLWIYDGAYDNGISTSWDSVTVNGSAITDYSQIPLGQRVTVEGFKSSGANGIMTVFAHQTESDGFMKGIIYGIKFYNGSTLVANYDMTTGTINDQTGNGNNATLSGGTWVKYD